MPSFSRIACFNTRSSLLPDVLGDFRDLVNENKAQEAISACAELAFDKSYKFFALGYNGKCRSGPNARHEYHIKGSISDTKCPNGIGIDKRIAVYTFGKFVTTTVNNNTNKKLCLYLCFLFVCFVLFCFFNHLHFKERNLNRVLPAWNDLGASKAWHPN